MNLERTNLANTGVARKILTGFPQRNKLDVNQNFLYILDWDGVYKLILISFIVFHHGIIYTYALYFIIQFEFNSALFTLMAEKFSNISLS